MRSFTIYSLFPQSGIIYLMATESKPPYGYKKVMRNSKGVIVIDPEAAAQVRAAFKKYLAA